jgi:hypothetical protein
MVVVVGVLHGNNIRLSGPAVCRTKAREGRHQTAYLL